MKRGQSIMETAVLLLVIVSALIVMQVYVKRGIQGRLRKNVEDIGDQYDFQAAESNFTLRHVSNATTTTNTETVNMVIGSWSGPYYTSTTDTVSVTTSQIETHYDNTTRNGYENIAAP